MSDHTLTLTLPELARWIRAVDRLADKLDEAGPRGLTEAELATLTADWPPLTEILVMNKRAAWRLSDGNLVSDMFSVIVRNTDGTYRVEVDENPAPRGDAA